MSANRRQPIHTYNNGQPYKPAAGRAHYREAVELRRFCGHSIVSGCPTRDKFIAVFKRELKIRAYTANTISNYVSNVESFLRWFGAMPHRVTIEDVRNFLETLADGGACPSTLAGHLSSIRTCFDKFCGRDVTLGLATPRRRKSQPQVLSTDEVNRVINAAPGMNIKLAIGIMYAAGLRNSELCRLQVLDLDFDRGSIRVFQGKGRTDRMVMLPQTFREALRELCNGRAGTAYLFPTLGTRKNRHMSPRTLQRWVALCVDLAGLKKKVTPHSFRHAFATHLLENGTDIRFIQKLLGHQRLETTTIYTRVAEVRTQNVTSPLDQLIATTHSQNASSHSQQLGSPESASQTDQRENSASQQPVVGSLQIKLELAADRKSASVQLSIAGPRPTSLPGITVYQNDRNWLELQLPPTANWQPAIDRLPKSQQARINAPEFFDLLRREIGRRFLWHTTGS